MASMLMLFAPSSRSIDWTSGFTPLSIFWHERHRPQGLSGSRQFRALANSLARVDLPGWGLKKIGMRDAVCFDTFLDQADHTIVTNDLPHINTLRVSERRSYQRHCITRKRIAISHRQSAIKILTSA